MDLYVLNNFNNYFNRKVIVLSTLQEYIEKVGENNYFRVPNTNFNPNDGVTTSHIIGSANHPFDKEWQPDYALLVDWPDGGQPRIVSRWYVVDAPRAMGNQYAVALKRDSAVDKIENLKNALCYMKKGYISDNDPMIVNNEGIQFNQKKTKELFLKDKSKVPWIVCYLARNRENTDHPDGWEVTAKYFPAVDGYYDDPNDPNYDELQIIWNYLKNKTTATTYNYLNNIGFNFGGICGWYASPYSGEAPTRKKSEFSDIKGIFNTTIVSGLPTNDMSLYNPYNTATDENQRRSEIRDLITRVNRQISSDFYNLYSSYMSRNGLLKNDEVEISDELMEKWKNKIIGSKQNDRVYKVIFDKINEQINENDVDNIVTNQFQQAISYLSYSGYTARSNGIFVVFPKITRIYQLNELIGTDIKITIPNKTYQTQESTYDILAFPLFDTRMEDENQIYNCLGSASKNIASAIKTQLGDFCYDVQILPFAPFQSLIDAELHEIDLSRAYTSQYILVSRVDNPNSIVTVGIVAPLAHFTLDIDSLGTSIYNDEEISVSSELTLTNRKIQANTDMWRLSSPNYASQFEFNIAKMVDINGGISITKFNVDCTYRPYNPYVKVNPDFNFLYGKDFNDARGLIFSGDFGITTMSDAWVNYQLQNKNYQNMFDRQIQNMETNRAIAREQDQWNLISGGVNSLLGIGGAVGGGAVAGGLKGGPWGAVAGAAAGLLGGGVSAGMNIAGLHKQKEWNERTYQEQRSFTTDMFNMNMDNIKALPQAITHSSSVSLNFKFYPILEYYTCTDIEKQALQEKIKYNGMTIGRIGNVRDFINENEETFVQGEIIRIEGIGDDAHIAQDIYNELNKGLFFIPNETEPNKEVK